MRDQESIKKDLIEAIRDCRNSYDKIYDVENFAKDFCVENDIEINDGAKIDASTYLENREMTLVSNAAQELNISFEDVENFVMKSI